MPPKRTIRRGDRAGNALARRAREAEQAFRATSPEAKLPPEESRETRREREAKLVYEARNGNENAAEKLWASLQRARAEAAEREQLRPGRKRPHKHLPAGFVQWPFVTDAAGSRQLVAHGEASTGKVVTVRPGASSVDTWEPVTTQLDEEAGVLRAICDLDARSPRRLGGDLGPFDDSMKWQADAVREHGGTWIHVHFDAKRGRSVCPEVARAIRSAAKIINGVWISILLAKIEAARVVEERRLRGDDVDHGDAFRPNGILALLVIEMLYLGLELPAYVDERVVAWVHQHTAVGVTRGGGKSSKLAVPQMRRLLADPKRLAAAMAKSAPRTRMH